MDALETHPYWVGRLAMCIAQSVHRIERAPSEAAARLREVVEELIQAPCISDALRDELRKEIK
jgi:hypothetical protein